MLIEMLELPVEALPEGEPLNQTATPPWWEQVPE
jgi:hypothetical protein